MTESLSHAAVHVSGGGGPVGATVEQRSIAGESGYQKGI